MDTYIGIDADVCGTFSARLMYLYIYRIYTCIYIYIRVVESQGTINDKLSTSLSVALTLPMAPLFSSLSFYLTPSQSRCTPYHTCSHSHVRIPCGNALSLSIKIDGACERGFAP